MDILGERAQTFFYHLRTTIEQHFVPELKQFVEFALDLFGRAVDVFFHAAKNANEIYEILKPALQNIFTTAANMIEGC